jgi:hypothetical protein
MCTTNHCTELLPLYLQAGVWDDHIDAHVMEVLHHRSSGLKICSTYLDALLPLSTPLDNTERSRPIREAAEQERYLL